MNDKPPSRLLQRAAERTSERVFFLGSSLASFQEARGIDDSELARVLHCDQENLARLRLCRRPDVDGAAFQVEVRAIAERFHASDLSLAQLLREVAAIDAMREAGQPRTAGFLMAARERRRPRRGRHRDSQ